MRCPNCGMDTNMDVCPVCGEALDQSMSGFNNQFNSGTTLSGDDGAGSFGSLGNADSGASGGFSLAGSDTPAEAAKPSGGFSLAGAEAPAASENPGGGMSLAGGMALAGAATQTAPAPQPQPNANPYGDPAMANFNSPVDTPLYSSSVPARKSGSGAGIIIAIAVVAALVIGVIFLLPGMSKKDGTAGSQERLTEFVEAWGNLDVDGMLHTMHPDLLADAKGSGAAYTSQIEGYRAQFDQIKSIKSQGVQFKINCNITSNENITMKEASQWLKDSGYKNSLAIRKYYKNPVLIKSTVTATASYGRATQKQTTNCEFLLGEKNGKWYIVTAAMR